MEINLYNLVAYNLCNLISIHTTHSPVKRPDVNANPDNIKTRMKMALKTLMPMALETRMPMALKTQMPMALKTQMPMELETRMPMSMRIIYLPLAPMLK